jgi:hypothetical protein
MPRLHFMRNGWVEKTPPAVACNTIIEDVDKKELRQEIKHWWQAVAEHLDKVVSRLFCSWSSYLNLLAGGRVYRQNIRKEFTSVAL